MTNDFHNRAAAIFGTREGTVAWPALGYETWDAYCTAEFGTARLRLPREERQEVVASLRESGLSVRAISSATGIGIGTVHRELATVPNGTVPDRVLSLDGRERPAARPGPTTETEPEAAPEAPRPKRRPPPRRPSNAHTSCRAHGLRPGPLPSTRC